jgi:hypothetical protein
VLPLGSDPVARHPCADSIEWAARPAGVWRVIRARWNREVVLHVILIREGGSQREAIDFMRQGICPEDRFLMRRVVEGPDGWHSEGASEVVDEAQVARTCNVPSLAEIGPQSPGDDLPLGLRRDLAEALPGTPDAVPESGPPMVDCPIHGRAPCQEDMLPDLELCLYCGWDGYEMAERGGRS